MKKLLTFTAIIILLFTSCKDFLDVNRNPNATSTAPMETILPAAMESAASVMGNYYFVLGEIWAQHWTSDINAPDYQTEDSYNVTAGDYSYEASWSTLYSGSLMDFQAVRDSAMKKQEWAYYLIATVMQAYIYQVLVDFYDQIPFTEALMGVNAHYDYGYVVYDSLISRIDFALEKFNSCTACSTPEKNDLIFSGSMSDWVAFANTLKLKIYLRQINKRPQVAEQGIRDLYASGAQFLTKDARYELFLDEAGSDNYFYAREYRDRGNINMRASKTLLDYMKQFEDPRLDYLFYRPKNAEDNYDNHRGIYQGDFRNVYTDPDGEKNYSRPRIIATTPVFFMTEAESYFLQAEAKVRFTDLPGDDAATLFNNAILADINKLVDIYAGEPINDDENLPYTMTGNILDVKYYTDFDPNTMPTDTLLKRIFYQKWISFVNTEGAEAFFEHNRTGYPEESPINPGDNNFDSLYVKGQFTVSVTGVLPSTNPYPKRLLFPSSEQSRNPYTPSVQPLYTPVWWDPQSDFTPSK